MKILYAHGESILINGVINALIKLGITYEVYPKLQNFFQADEKEVEEVFHYIREHEITHVMSINLVDNLALATERAGIIYISLIWDAPYYNLLSDYGRMPHCWYAVFDKADAGRFMDRKVPHVLYQPLAVDGAAIEKWDKENEGVCPKTYEREICFIGNLYDENFYDEFCQNMPQPLQDYFTDVFERTVFQWDGVNRLRGAVSNELLAYIRKVTPGFQLVNFFEIEDARYFESFYLIRKAANIERVCILNMLAERFPVTLYTASKTAGEVLHHVNIMPPVSAGHESYLLFKKSKINLNISLKGIEAGTPLRVMDIMGAGGFVMTNYSPETAELFEEDKEIVMFRTPEELLQKVDYYLNHEEERERIAKAGHEKVMCCYTYEKKIKQLLTWITEDEG